MNNPLLTEAIGVYFINMDVGVHEQVVKNEDDSYTIFINAKLNRDSQMAAYHHALMHILNDDFNKTDVDSIEANAHV